MQPLKAISAEISALEAVRDYGNMTPEDVETLAVLNLCYDLLTRTSAVQAINVKQPDEMKEPGFEDEFVNNYGVSSNQLADFAFAISTKKGTVNLRALLRELLVGTTKTKVAEQAGVRNATISDYLNSKSSLTTDNFEKIIEACFKINNQ